jgi:hypothetical protein
LHSDVDEERDCRFQRLRRGTVAGSAELKEVINGFSARRSMATVPSEANCVKTSERYAVREYRHADARKSFGVA